MYKISQEEINSFAQCEIGLKGNDVLISAASQHVSAGEGADFYHGFASAMDLACSFSSNIFEGDTKGQIATSAFAALAGLAATECKKAQVDSNS